MYHLPEEPTLNMPKSLLTLALLSCFLLTTSIARADETSDKPLIKIGIIGLDTSHATAFAKLFNDPKAEGDLAGFRVVAAYPKGSLDIPSSVNRVPQFTEAAEKMGIEIVPSIAALLEKVDAVLLETNDGRPHLEQALQVFKAGKPVFIDKPLAGSLADCLAIYQAAEDYKVPVFTSSSLRYVRSAQEARNGSLGKVIGCDTYSPCSLEKSHPDLFWYGIHGVELLFTVMGPGCTTVTRANTPGTEVVVGIWDGGRIGTFRGIRAGKPGYGGTVFGSEKNQALGSYEGYRPLVVEIAKFFRTGEPPVSAQESIEIYAFMEAADESKRNGGSPVDLKTVIDKARPEAEQRLAELKR